MFSYEISMSDHVQAGNSRDEANAHHAHVTFVAPSTAACSSAVVVTTAGGRGHWMRVVVAVVHWIDVCRDPTQTIQTIYQLEKRTMITRLNVPGVKPTTSN